MNMRHKAISLFIAVVWVLCISAQAYASQAESEKIMIQGTDMVWYQQTPQSPNVPEAPGLLFALAAADSANGPTVALFGAYHLGTPFIEYYGGQLVRAIRVVALDMASGRVYQSDLNSPDHPPIMLEASDKDVAAAGPGWSTESGYFNLDLPALLGLPQRAASYRVFLWLDDLISNIVDVQIPANPSRVERPATERIPVDNLQFAADPNATENKADLIRISLAKKTDKQFLQGTWMPVNLANPDQPVIWVLAASHRERRFAWLSLYAKEIPKNLSPLAFQLEVNALLEATDVSQKRFFMALSLSSASTVQVLQSP